MKPAAMQAIYSLWDELAAFPASRTEEALDHLMRWFQKNLDADNVIWLGSILMLEEETAKADPLLGWRLRARKSFLQESESYRKLVASYFANEHYGRLTPAFYRKGKRPDADIHIGMASRQVVRGAGRFRVHQMRDGWINYAKFRQTEHYRLYYTEAGIADRIWLIFPVSSTVESIVLIDRYRSHPHFTKNEVEIAGTTLRGIGEFHRRLLLQNGVLRGDKLVSPLKQLILQGLLTGKSEKEIAASLDQKPTTMRKYVQELYLEFGVSTRPALMALWLGET